MDERERGEQEREIETERERTLIGIIVVFSLDRKIIYCSVCSSKG
jgi:hypothetical protein